LLVCGLRYVLRAVGGGGWRVGMGVVVLSWIG